jgi:hypothetical protein
MPLPVYSGPFGPPQAERLVWRAGFGPRPGEERTLAARGLDGAVAGLLTTGSDNLVGKPPQIDGHRLFPLNTFGHDPAAPGIAGNNGESFVRVVKQEYTLTRSRQSVPAGRVSLELVNLRIGHPRPRRAVEQARRQADPLHAARTSRPLRSNPHAQARPVRVVVLDRGAPPEGLARTLPRTRVKRSAAGADGERR